MADKLLIMGEYNTAINNLLGINVEKQTIFRSTGLPSHIVKRKHFKCLKYIDNIPEIIDDPDYVGLHTEKDGTFSIEYIKIFKFNILVAVKVDGKSDYLYISTVHDIQESKIRRRLYSGRLKKFKNNIDK